jgi:fatty acid CoA ligase FadD32
MAEATLTVTTCPPGRPPREIRVSRADLSTGRVAAPHDPDDVLELVSCGMPLSGTTVRILPDPHLLPDSGAEQVASADSTGTGASRPTLGEVWISGPQVVAGGPDHELDGVPGRRTGDLGFLWDGELVLLGRARDRFQVRGSNFYCAELEALVAESCPEIRPGRVAVFACPPGPQAPDPEVVVLAEPRAGEHTATPQDPPGPALADRIRLVLRQGHGLAVDRVCWVLPRTLPVTTSGKLRRAECRERYLRHDLEIISGGDQDAG